MRNRKLVTLVTVAVAIVLGSSMALADDLNLGGSYSYPIYLTGGFIGTGTATEGGGPIGPSSLNGIALSYVYCVDIPDQVYVSSDYPNTIVTNNGQIAGSQNNFNAGGVGAYTTSGALQTVNNAVEVAWLAHTFGAGATTFDQQVGLQAAIWSVIYSGVTLAPGNTTGAVADYTADLAALATAGGINAPNYVGQFAWLSPSGNSTSVSQGLLTYVPDGGMTLMLLGGTLIGLGTLRRKFRV